MPDSIIIRQELDQFTAGLLARGLSAGWIGLELMTLGMGMLTNAMGSCKMAEHLRHMAARFESSECRESDNGYSSIG